MIFNARYAIGDIHGWWGEMVREMKNVALNDVLFVQVGDFNIGYEGKKKELQKLFAIDEVLAEKNSKLWIIRGNHDNPFWFRNDKYTKQKSQLENIEFIQDWTVRTVNEDKILFFGGAHSIDRKSKKAKGQWWPEECIDFQDHPKDVDIIIAHNSPDTVEPYTFGPIVKHHAKKDETLLDDLRGERAKLTEMVSEIPTLQKYIYGHFHYPHFSQIESVKYRCVDILEFYEF